MFVKVRPLRCRGRKLSWRDIENGPVYLGHLVTYSMSHRVAGSYRVASLSAAGDHKKGDMLPPLYEPQLVGIGARALHLRGYERWEGEGGAYSVLQEWFCEPASGEELMKSANRERQGKSPAG